MDPVFLFWKWPLHLSALSVALGLVVYLITLHPFSGMLGGLVFYLCGWLLSSLSFFLGAYTLVRLLPVTSPLLSSAIAVILCLLFTAAIAWKTIAKEQKIKFEQHIFKELPYAAPRNIDEFLKVYLFVDGVDLRSVPLEIIHVGGDEGCMCMYFTSPKSVESSMRQAISKVFDNKIMRYDSYTGFKGEAGSAATEKGIEIHLNSSKLGGGTQVEIKAVKQQELLGELKIIDPDGVLDIAFKEGYGRDVRLKKHFIPMALKAFYTKNLWYTLLFKSRKDRVQKEVENFFAKVFKSTSLTN